jgi:hypothetical protein
MDARPLLDEFFACALREANAGERMLPIATPALASLFTLLERHAVASPHAFQPLLDMLGDTPSATIEDLMQQTAAHLYIREDENDLPFLPLYTPRVGDELTLSGLAVRDPPFPGESLAIPRARIASPIARGSLLIAFLDDDSCLRVGRRLQNCAILRVVAATTSFVFCHALPQLYGALLEDPQSSRCSGLSPKIRVMVCSDELLNLPREIRLGLAHHSPRLISKFDTTLLANEVRAAWVEQFGDRAGILSKPVITSSPSQLLWWLARNCPLPKLFRNRLLTELDCIFSRLSFFRSVLKMYCSTPHYLACEHCNTPLLPLHDVVNPFSRGQELPPLSTLFSNPVSHPTRLVVTPPLPTARMRSPYEMPSMECPWFPSYSWTALYCDGCNSHIGFRYTYAPPALYLAFRHLLGFAVSPRGPWQNVQEALVRARFATSSVPLVFDALFESGVCVVDDDGRTSRTGRGRREGGGL